MAMLNNQSVLYLNVQRNARTSLNKEVSASEIGVTVTNQQNYGGFEYVDVTYGDVILC